MTTIIISLFPVFSSWLMIAEIGGTLAFLIGIVGANVWPRRLYSHMYAFGAFSLGGITIAGFIAIFMLIIGNLFHFAYSSDIGLIFFVTTVLAANIWGTYASWVSRITTYSVKIKKEHHWHGKRIVMIADTHYGNIYGLREARTLVKRINQLNPEVVLIPGDFFDGPLIDYESIVEEFQHIRAPHGVYFANGNHEEYTHSKQIIKTIKNPINTIHRRVPTEHLQKSFQNGDQHIIVLNNNKIEIDGMIIA